jgi:hypothetical protein
MTQSVLTQIDTATIRLIVASAEPTPCPTPDPFRQTCLTLGVEVEVVDGQYTYDGQFSTLWPSMYQLRNTNGTRVGEVDTHSTFPHSGVLTTGQAVAGQLAFYLPPPDTAAEVTYEINGQMIASWLIP